MKLLRWVRDRLKHKISHFRLSRLMDTIMEHGVAFVVIFIIWEIIEDVLFPLLFWWLGTYVSPWFLGGVPFGWLLCLHPIMVPLIWSIWIKFSRREKK